MANEGDSKQPLFLLLLFALLGIGLPVGMRGGAEAPAAASAGTASKPAPAAPEARDEKREPTCDDAFAKPLRDLQSADPIIARYDLRTLIATVPDPIESPLDYGFDRSVEAIRSALAATGYQADRFYLPWDADLRARQKGDKAPECHTLVPGRVLFHRERTGELLQVLLVGETATWGLHGGVFHEALKIAAAGPGTSIDIAGPSFSGTASSLRTGIERFACKAQWGMPRSFRVVNGSATRPRLGEKLAADRLIDCDVTQPRVHLRIDYSATIPDDEVMIKRFAYHAVREMEALEGSRAMRVRGKLDRFATSMAILVEEGSAYGSTIPEVMGIDAALRNEPCLQVPLGGGAVLRGEYGATCLYDRDLGDGDRQRCKDDPRFCAGYVPYIVVQYPPHIARLRAEYEKQQRSSSDKRRDEAAPAARALELSFDRERALEPTEVLPPLSPRTLHSQELALSQALSVMCRQDMRWVGILGTDTMDRLFLARAVKQACGNVRLFFLDSDVFYTHPEHGADLDGSLVISAYPLFPQNRAWSAPFDTDTIASFASSSDQGLFNAVVKLEAAPAVKPDAAVREIDPPFCKDEGGHRPVWITAVGNGSFWPVAVLRSEQDGMELCSPSGSLRSRGGHSRAGSARSKARCGIGDCLMHSFSRSSP